MNLLRLCATAMLLLIVQSVVAQKSHESYSLSGNVHTTTGEPLPSASIYIADLRRGAIADKNGNYIIKNIPTGNYVVEAAFTGYKSDVQNLYFNKNLVVNFQLEISITEEKEIVITGSSKATSLKRNPIPIVTVSKEFLQQNLNTNIINALAKVPGVNAVTTGPNVSKPFIRGLGYNRILTLYDGIRQEGQQWGDEHGVEVDENAVERVEVIKGPSSLLYGSDAIAGVVNLIPPKAPPQGTTTGGISATYQTNNKLMEASAHAESYRGNFSWGLVGSHKMAADYQNKIDGRVYNTGFNQSSVYLQASLHKDWGYSRFGASFFNDLQEIPSGKRDSATRKFEKQLSDDDWQIVSQAELNSYKIAPVHQRIQHYRIYNITSFTAGKDRATIQLGFQRNIRQEFDDPQSSDPALFLELNTLTYDGKYFFHQAGKTSVTMGINGLVQNNNVNKGHEFIIPSYRQFDVGPFIYTKYSSGKLEIAGGLRYDWRHFKNDELYVTGSDDDTPVFGSDTIGAKKLFSDFTQTFSGFSGSAGLSYRFDKQWSAKLNVARGFRAPNISEISANGIHTGAKIYQLGNEHFKPEFSFQQDLGITFSSEHVTINADVFNNNIQNYIFNQKVVNDQGQDSIIVPGFETFQYTASRARLRGGELSIDIHPHPLDWLHFENALSFVSAENTGGGKITKDEKYLPFIPPFHTRSELRANFPKAGKSFKDLFIRIGLEVYAAQNRVFALNGTETPTPGYQLVNAGIGADICNRKGNPIFNFSLMGNNLFDIAYQSHMSRLKYFEDYPGDPRGHSGIYDMGRNISFKISVPF